MEAAHTSMKSLSDPVEKNMINKPSTYTVNGRRFVVTHVFSETGRDTFGTIFMRLLRAEVSS